MTNTIASNNNNNLGKQSVNQEEMIMNLEQRRREVRKYTQIRRTYNLDLEESTMAQTRNNISKIFCIAAMRYKPGGHDMVKIPYKLVFKCVPFGTCRCKSKLICEYLI